MRRLVGPLGLVGVALVLGFATRAALMGGVDDRALTLAVLGAAALLLYAWLDRDDVGRAAAEPGVQASASAVALVLAAAIVGGLAWRTVLAFDHTWDLTAGGVHTLSPHTEAVLDTLPREAEVLAFFPAGSGLQATFDALARRYVDRSAKVRLRLVDPLREPALARRYEVDVEAGEVVLVSGAKSEHLVGRFDEDALTDALVRVTSDRDHVVCWSTGHGEADPDDVHDPADLGAAVQALEGEDFQVQRIRLLTGVADPACEVVVVARPAIDLLPYERAALLGWIAGGGRALVLLEPGTAPGLARSLRAVGVGVGDDLVVDEDASRRPAGVDDPSVLVLDPRSGGGHPVTASLRGEILFALARSVATVDGTAGVAARVLLRAGPHSHVEAAPGAAATTSAGDVPVAVAVEITDADALALPPLAGRDVDPDEVRAGVVRVIEAVRAGASTGGLGGLDADALAAVSQGLGATLAAEVDARPSDTVDTLVGRVLAALRGRLPVDAGPLPAPPPRHSGGRVLVLGDAGFATNRGVDYGADIDLFEDAVRWLAAQDARLGAGAEDVGDRLPITSGEAALVALLALVVAPGAALLLAARAGWRRRSG